MSCSPEHTVDPLGLAAPAKVGWRGFRSFAGGTPYTSGGNPTVDWQRFEMFQSGELKQLLREKAIA
jgi:hypothetical protein